ncbi:AAA family ATPase, partial [Nostoc sp.]
MSEKLSEILNRISAGSRAETDIQALVSAIESKQIILATGEQSVALGGTADGAVIVTGDNNTVRIVLSQDATTTIQLLLTERTPFQSLIQDKTEDFVGRKYAFNAIQAFIEAHSKGYFTIIGDPGMGKSAILAKYVQDTGCIAHFNMQLQGLNRADQFLESVCKQLVKLYQLPYDPLPSNATRDGEFLGQLLDEVAQKRNGKPVVIAVDALDEVDSASYRDANILYLPPYLPDGVYFIMTRRRGVEVPLTIYTPQEVLSLLDYEVDSQRDVRVYIQNR